MTRPPQTAQHDGAVPRASALDSARTVAEVLLPLVARGIIIRRPRVLRMAERLDADRRAVRRMQRLRRRYGPGPVLLRLPGRSLALLLDPAHVHRVLEQSPEPFAVANLEKRGALGHFQPHGVLLSHGQRRADRRRFNEEVLDFARPVHRLADDLVAKVNDEAARVLAGAERSGDLSWDAFATGWWCMVRRVVLGDAARDDHELTDMLARLRADANWAGLRPRRRDVRARFARRLEAHLQRAEPGSLARMVADTSAPAGTDPSGQVPQWLFAFDAAGMAAFRALALIDAHPEQAGDVRRELDGRDLSVPHHLPHLRACVLESVRLWPTTPAVLRDTTTDTAWDAGTLPRGTAVIVFVPFFHRDELRLPQAHRFAPELWLEERSAEDWPLIPFSAGPAECAGRSLVLLLSSALLAALLRDHELRLRPPGRLGAGRPLPGTLSPFDLRFALA